MMKNVMHESITDYSDEYVQQNVNFLTHHVCNVGSIVMRCLNHELAIMQSILLLIEHEVWMDKIDLKMLKMQRRRLLIYYRE